MIAGAIKSMSQNFRSKSLIYDKNRHQQSVRELTVGARKTGNYAMSTWLQHALSALAGHVS